MSFRFSVLCFVLHLVKGQLLVNERQECGGEFFTTNGSIYSPNYSLGNYPPNAQCVWTITVPADKRIQFDFPTMDIEIGPPDCLFDGVAIYDYKADGSKYDLPLDHLDSLGMTKYCGKSTFSDIISATNKVDVVFTSDESDEASGFHLTWLAVPIPADEFNCTFETTLCRGWVNLGSLYDEFDWGINSGKTVTAGTGPNFDHTLKNENGSYAYVEASAPQKLNHRAMLSTPYVNFTAEDTGICVRYWYHMLGENIGTLAVAVESNGTSTIMTSLDGQQSEQWLQGELQVPKQDLPFRIIFIGVRGGGFRGDIALDDVTLVREPCNYVTETSTEETTTAGFVEPPIPTVADCLDNEYKCSSGFSCISQTFVCDGVPDCLDSDDENNCDDDLTGLPPILTNVNTTQVTITTPQTTTMDKTTIPTLPITTESTSEMVTSSSTPSVTSPSTLSMTSSLATTVSTVAMTSSPMPITTTTTAPMMSSTEQITSSTPVVTSTTQPPTSSHMAIETTGATTMDRVNATVIFRSTVSPSITSTVASGVCGDDSVACSDGICIPIMWLCDNVEDCNDAEDELDCPDKESTTWQDYGEYATTDSTLMIPEASTTVFTTDEVQTSTVVISTTQPTMPTSEATTSQATTTSQPTTTTSHASTTTPQTTTTTSDAITTTSQSTTIASQPTTSQATTTTTSQPTTTMSEAITTTSQPPTTSKATTTTSQAITTTTSEATTTTSQPIIATSELVTLPPVTESTTTKIPTTSETTTTVPILITEEPKDKRFTPRPGVEVTDRANVSMVIETDAPSTGKRGSASAVQSKSMWILINALVATYVVKVFCR
nr:flocculation protein FLO11 isoform X4 [Ciona intestinalis]XP_026693492.1 flocculation protein FLO11 isoform X5 [Ciona intestinalis]|eukprot:XP_026693491.1 flocculation protein FLO11 isoform X4 [Ciona intestinalis]